MRTHKDLDAWKKSLALVISIYEIASSFPKEEVYGLTSQIKRAIVSIPSNIAEGAARNHKKEFIQFLYIALGSGAELDTQLIIANKLGFISQEKLDELIDELNTISKMIQGLIKSINK